MTTALPAALPSAHHAAPSSFLCAGPCTSCHLPPLDFRFLEGEDCLVHVSDPQSEDRVRLGQQLPAGFPARCRVWFNAPCVVTCHVLTLDAWPA